jgi:uncharacterized protein (AIM24 family)
MAKFVIRNPAIKINSVDLSTYVKEVTVQMTAADVDMTASGAGGQEHAAGIRDDRFVLNAYSDFAAGAMDATVYPLFAGSSLFLVEVWANGTASSATNPKYSGTVILLEYHPIDGAVGDASMTPLEMPVNGTISRATS